MDVTAIIMRFFLRRSLLKNGPGSIFFLPGTAAAAPLLYPPPAITITRELQKVPFFHPSPFLLLLLPRRKRIMSSLYSPYSIQLLLLLLSFQKPKKWLFSQRLGYAVYGNYFSFSIGGRRETLYSSARCFLILARRPLCSLLHLSLPLSSVNSSSSYF